MPAEPPLGYFQCPDCQKRYGLRPALAGKVVQCKCGRKMIAPQLPADPPAAAGASSRRDRAPEPSLADILDDFPGEDETLTPIAGSAGSVRRSMTESGEGDSWKWWYYVVVGVLIAAFSVWQLFSGEPILRLGGRRGGPIGGFLLAALCIVVGLFSRPGADRRE